MSASGKYLAGVGIALCTTLMSAIGLCLQKRAHKKQERTKLLLTAQGISAAKAPAPYKEVQWILGIAFMAAAALISLAVFALVGQSVASSFASITIVYNIILAYFFLNESIRRLDILVSALMITGTVLAVVFGSAGVSGDFSSLDKILNTWKRPAAIIGFSLFGTIIIINALYLHLLDRAEARGRLSRSSFQFRSSIFLRCLNAGIFSGFVGSLSKAVVSIFSASVGGSVGQNLARWEVWVFLVLLPMALVCQIIFLNSALKRFDATEAVPLYQSMVVIFGVVFGWTIFNEAQGKTGGDIAGFCAGIILIVIGILCLLQKKQPVAETMSPYGAVQTLIQSGDLPPKQLHRSHSAPPALMDRMTRDTTGKYVRQSQCSGIANISITVPVFTRSFTQVQHVFAAVSDCSQPLTPKMLLTTTLSPKEGASRAERLFRSLDNVDTIAPVSWRIMSARAQDRLTRSSWIVAESCKQLRESDCKLDCEPAVRMEHVEIAPLALLSIITSQRMTLSGSLEGDQRTMTSLRQLLSPQARMPPSASPRAPLPDIERAKSEPHVQGITTDIRHVQSADQVPRMSSVAEQPGALDVIVQHIPEVPSPASTYAKDPNPPSFLLISLAVVQHVRFDIDVVNALVRASDLKTLLAPMNKRVPEKYKKLRRLSQGRYRYTKTSTAVAPSAAAPHDSGYAGIEVEESKYTPSAVTAQA